MRCPQCARVDDKVVDSRTAEDGAAIRRRRECLTCGRRFTTYERLEELPFVVIKRSGTREPFDRGKIVAGLRAAAKNRPVPLEKMEHLAAEVEEALRLEGSEIRSEQIGMAVLERLRTLDEVAYMRFASVYKGFSELGDFAREVGALVKQSEPKSGVEPNMATALPTGGEPNAATEPPARAEPDAVSKPNSAAHPDAAPGES